MIDGGPAFPALHSIDGNWVKEPLDKYAGMSLRDFFAAQALKGWLSSATFSGRADIDRRGVARFSYELADAMLEAREQ